MVKILHSADLHLGSTFGGVSMDTAQVLARRQKGLLSRLLRLKEQEECQIMLLAGDLFDAQPSEALVRDTVSWLERMEIPVCIAPGNHDYLGTDSPYNRVSWPSNVHIFRRAAMESVSVPKLDLRIWGAGFETMDCPSLLEGFRAEGAEPYQVAVLHGDPTAPRSPSCPVTRGQVRDSGLQYLALGHIHKAGSFTSGSTLCAWPGCPMGRGFDETGVKGALVVTLGEGQPDLRFFDLGLGRFEELKVEVGEDPLEDILAALPADTGEDIYRITLTGTAEKIDLAQLRQRLKGSFLELILEDETTRPVELWENAGQDSLEGQLFAILRQMEEGASPEDREIYRLSARITRRLLNGEEVELP